MGQSAGAPLILNGVDSLSMHCCALANGARTNSSSRLSHGGGAAMELVACSRSRMVQ